jgi:hypothetical protein
VAAAGAVGPVGSRGAVGAVRAVGAVGPTPPRGRSMQVVVRGCAEDHQPEETQASDFPSYGGWQREMSQKRVFDRPPRVSNTLSFPPEASVGQAREVTAEDERWFARRRNARHARRFRGGMPPGRVPPEEGPKPGVKGHTCLHYSFAHAPRCTRRGGA